MTNQHERNSVRDFTRPWSERRGIESIDRNAEVVLVKIPLDSLSDALAKRAMEVRRNVLGSEIEVSGFFQFAYHLVGHSWSILINDEVIEPNRVVASLPPKLDQLSKELKAPVIRLIMSDTTGVVEYVIFENGEVTEYFSGSIDENDNSNEFSLKPQRYILSSSHNPEDKQFIYFWSRHRQVTAEEIGDMWDFANKFLVNNDAFDPGIDAHYLLKTGSVRRGGRYIVQNSGFTLVVDHGQKVTSIPDLIRVDYFRYGN